MRIVCVLLGVVIGYHLRPFTRDLEVLIDPDGYR